MEGFGSMYSVRSPIQQELENVSFIAECRE